MLDWMVDYLERHDDPCPLVSTRWLLSDATDLSNMQLYVNLDRPLSPDELDVLRENVKLRAQGEPLQYITGKTSFRHIELAVKPGVLIPRPETEVLVSEVLRLLPQYRYNASDLEDEAPEPYINVADLCTGSGCIACSIAYENPLTNVVATDISDECVRLANENVRSLGLCDRVRVLQCDLGSAVDGSLVGQLDAIVSNPPYVPSAILPELPGEVRGYEPEIALDGGEDGLDVFRRIAHWAYDALKESGFLAVELHETTLESAASIAGDIGFAQTNEICDLAGKPRVLIAHKTAPDSLQANPL